MGAINSMFWREKIETQSITPNSMSPIPKHKFINYARKVAENIDDSPTFKMYGKSMKQKNALETYYDYYNY
tara:strand:+ start:1155 stop:1367 length:213 start_codon:yes stop_codon:yes gene_type:complete